MKKREEKFKDRPKIIIDLPPIFEAYCRFVFNTPVDQEEIIPSRKHIIGKALFGLAEKMKERKELRFENPVQFYLPETRYSKYSSKKNYYYLGAEETQAFIDRVETLYSGWVEIMFMDGYAMNLDQYSIIESILDTINVRMNATNFDQVKKYDYRKRKAKVRLRSLTILKQRILAS